MKKKEVAEEKKKEEEDEIGQQEEEVAADVEEDEIAALKKKQLEEQEEELLLAMKMKQLEEEEEEDDLPKQLLDSLKHAIQDEIKGMTNHLLEETRTMVDTLSRSGMSSVEARVNTWKQGLKKELLSEIEGLWNWLIGTRRLMEDTKVGNLPGNYVYGPHQEIVRLPDNYVPTESGTGKLAHYIPGLAIYEDIFSLQRMSYLIRLVNGLRSAGENGKLSGDTYLPGPDIPCIRFGVSNVKDSTSCVEPIPPQLRAIIEKLSLWRLLHQRKLPNSCQIYFYDEEAGSPWVDPFENHPLCSLLLSDSRMTFNRRIGGGPLELSLKKGSLIVIHVDDKRNNTIRGLMCPSKTKRIIINFSMV